MFAFIIRWSWMSNLHSEFRVCCDFRSISSWKRYSIRLYPQLFVGGIMSCLQESSCLICGRDHVLFVGELMSYLQEGSCLICRRIHVLFVGGLMSYLQEGSCLICIACVCFLKVVSSIYCAVFLFWFSSSCVTCVASFSGLSIFDWHFCIL